MKIKVGLIGFGRMGQFYLKEMQKSGQWDIVYICDVNTDALELAKLLSPESKTITVLNLAKEKGAKGIQFYGICCSGLSAMYRYEGVIPLSNAVSA